MLLACQNSGGRDVVGSYYGSLAFADLGKNWRGTEWYGKKCMEVTDGWFCR